FITNLTHIHTDGGRLFFDQGTPDATYHDIPYGQLTQDTASTNAAARPGGDCSDFLQAAHHTAVMNMADGAGQGIGRVRRRQAVQLQEPLYHQLDLFFGSMTAAGDGFLDLQSGVLMHIQSTYSQRTQGGTPSLPQQKGRGRVAVDKDFF